MGSYYDVDSILTDAQVWCSLMLFDVSPDEKSGRKYHAPLISQSLDWGIWRATLVATYAIIATVLSYR